MTASQSPDVTAQVEAFMLTLPQYPHQPTRAIGDAVDVLAEIRPSLGRPLVDRIELEPDHRDLAPLLGRRLKELRPLGTDIRIPEAARAYDEYLAETEQG